MRPKGFRQHLLTNLTNPLPIVWRKKTLILHKQIKATDLKSHGCRNLNPVPKCGSQLYYTLHSKGSKKTNNPPPFCSVPLPQILSNQPLTPLVFAYGLNFSFSCRYELQKAAATKNIHAYFCAYLV